MTRSYFFILTDRLQKKPLVKNLPFKESTNCRLNAKWVTHGALEYNTLDKMKQTSNIKGQVAPFFPKLSTVRDVVQILPTYLYV